MTPLHPLRELTLLRIRQFLREPEALFWTFGFPIIMAVGLGLAFGNPSQERSPVAVVRGSVAEHQIAALRRDPELEVRLLDPAAADEALRKGQAVVVLTGQDTLEFRFDPGRAESRSARLLADRAVQARAGAQPVIPVLERPERQRGSRYIDWVMPGIIGLNLMSTSMWGLGFGIVYMRQKGQLKRMTATPMRKRDFLLAQILARLVFICLEVPPIILFAWLAFDVEVAGSVAALAGIVVLGAVAFAGLGLLCASRTRTIEGVSGILNVVMLPMFVLSGVFFPADRYPDVMQPVIRILPLTALNDALRAVYNDGLSLSATAIPLTVLAGWTLLSFLAALRAFRWQ